MDRALLWLTRDLRIDDNLMFDYLASLGISAMALVFEHESASPHRAMFFHQSVVEMKNKLAKSKVQLFCARGLPKEEIPKWVRANSIDTILVSKPYNQRDQKQLDEVKAICSRVDLVVFDQSTLLRLEDLPFSLEDMPLVFTSFRKKVEQAWKVIKPIDSSLENVSGFDVKVPDSALLGEAFSHKTSWQMPYLIQGGEQAGVERVREYLWDTRCLSKYKDTRNGMIEKNDSSKFSPWLANGSLSVRRLYHEVLKYEAEIGANESTSWFVFELLWRDYFKFLSIKIGENLFSTNGIAQKKAIWRRDEGVFLDWCRGRTGVDFVDANMREFAATGWMSNRGRQNVASYLSKGLGIDWTLGAAYFEKNLIDSDPESNWGNWLYIAGVGTDPRDRVFNIQHQAQLYDPNRKYQDKWLERS